MAYYPKNKAKVKPSKEGDFIYLDDQTPFNGNYIQTSKNQYYEGDNINSPGRTLIPTQRRQRKNQLLSLLKNLLLNFLNSALIQQLLNELLSTLLNPGDIFNIEQLLGILNNAEGRELTDDEKNQAQELLDQIESDDVEGLDNSVINSSIYNTLKPSIYGKLNNNESPIATKTQPTDSDYNKGSYIRYFAKRNNSLNGYFEINKATYNSISQRKNQFDTDLYQVFNIRWALGKDAENTNTNILSRYERSLPGIKNLFNDPTEYTRAAKINLYTEGNELYYEDGTEYIGDYHIHPIEGPMVGAVHVSEPHSKLYYSYELGISKEEPTLQTPISEDQQSGLFKTIGYNEYYIKENKFGIYCEVLDTLASPDSVIYTSDTISRLVTTPEALVDEAMAAIKQDSGDSGLPPNYYVTITNVTENAIKKEYPKRNLAEAAVSNLKQKLKNTVDISSSAVDVAMGLTLETQPSFAFPSHVPAGTTKVSFTRLPYRRYGRLRKEEAFAIQESLTSLGIESTVLNRWTEPDQPSTFEEAFDQQSNILTSISQQQKLSSQDSSGRGGSSPGRGGYSR